MKVTNILWDVDHKEDLKNLPNEIELPDYIDLEDDDMISDYITDCTGFCHAGFSIE